MFAMSCSASGGNRRSGRVWPRGSGVPSQEPAGDWGAASSLQRGGGCGVHLRRLGRPVLRGGPGGPVAILSRGCRRGNATTEGGLSPRAD